ncbi:MAG: hypothetical protein V1729_05490 [Candidatus Woesearchaeota archaeon]
MVKKRYVGKGETLDTAIADLEKKLEKKGITDLEPVHSPEYTFKLYAKALFKRRWVTGEPNVSYTLARSSAFEKAGLKEKSYDPEYNRMEVLVGATYDTGKQLKTEPSGPCSDDVSYKTITDII